MLIVTKGSGAQTAAREKKGVVERLQQGAQADQTTNKTRDSQNDNEGQTNLNLTWSSPNSDFHRQTETEKESERFWWTHNNFSRGFLDGARGSYTQSPIEV
ncbi:unnamed protein product [[Candida] boidinii]|nr:unnamed protein product [[Candida] boidinii]